MTNIIEIKSLVPINYESREKFFLNENNEVQPLIDAIKSHYQAIVFDGMDGKTEAGRKAIKKLAAELNNKIKEIDDIGKSVTDILKAKPTKIDTGRRLIRESLTEVYNKIREPVVEYEKEQARIKAEQQAKEAEEQRRKDEELARLRAEKEQREREAKIAEEAAQKVRLEAENKVKKAQQEAEKVKREAELKEQQRLAEEKQKADEEARRNADEEHQRRINNQVVEAFCNFGIQKQIAIDVLKLIVKNKIPNITIKY